MKTLAHKLMQAGHRIKHDGSDICVMATPEAREIMFLWAASVEFFTDAGKIWARAKDPAETSVVDRLLFDIRNPAETRVVDRLLRDIRDPS